MRQVIFFSLLCVSLSCCGQSNTQTTGQNGQRVGGRCEGCEAIYENKIPFDQMNEVDTLPIFNEEGPKLIVSGTIYKKDGKTPAPGVIIYVYQTDQTGQYRTGGNETGWAKRHGSIRGWVKTNAQGQYKIYTVRPASYSQTGPPAHIHAIVKEAGKNEYWIDDFLFDDDPFLTANERSHHGGQGGNGILKLTQKDGVHYGERNIYLGKNIENYPADN